MRAKVKMSEFFLELFSEEIPAKLQVNARTNIFNNFKEVNSTITELNFNK